VKIDIPRILVHLRGTAVRSRQDAPGLAGRPDAEALAMRSLARVFGDRRRYERAQRLGRLTQRPLVRDGAIRRLPGPLAAWTQARDLPALPEQTFRAWWRSRP
jgi:L-lactate dehydrogenase complex protein LldF